MTSSILYIIGESNTGKTTTLNNVLGQSLGRFDWPISHERYLGGIQLGVVRDEFSGTDALGKHVQISVPGWLYGPYRPQNIVAEGIRFCTNKFMDGLLGCGWDIHILRLVAEEEVLSARQQTRTEKQLAWLKKHKRASVHRDHEQTKAWLKAHKSTIDNQYRRLSEKGVPCVTIDTSESFAEAESWLANHPIVTMVRDGSSCPTDSGGADFEIWRRATMAGRDLLKAAGVKRWQLEPAMASKEPIAGEEGDVIILFEHEGIDWQIKGEAPRVTQYARAKAKRLAKLAQEEKDADHSVDRHGCTSSEGSVPSTG